MTSVMDLASGDFAEAAGHREGRVNASPCDGDCEVIAGGFHGEGVVQELVLNRIVVIEAQSRSFPKKSGRQKR